jgi:hypothetical protein
MVMRFLGLRCSRKKTTIVAEFDDNSLFSKDNGCAGLCDRRRAACARSGVGDVATLCLHATGPAVARYRKRTLPACGRGQAMRAGPRLNRPGALCQFDLLTPKRTIPLTLSPTSSARQTLSLAGAAEWRADWRTTRRIPANPDVVSVSMIVSGLFCHSSRHRRQATPEPTPSSSGKCVQEISVCSFCVPADQACAATRIDRATTNQRDHRGERPATSLRGGDRVPIITTHTVEAVAKTGGLPRCERPAPQRTIMQCNRNSDNARTRAPTGRRSTRSPTRS